MKNTYLVWLEWPEKCFRINAAALRALRDMVSLDSEIIRVKSERGFLRELPKATHVITWNFKKEWFDIAKRLRVLSTPSAGRELVTKEGPKGVTIHFGGYHGGAMSETVIGMMLSWCRGIIAADRAGKWNKVGLSSMSYRLAGTKAVILGYGKIGRAIGSKLSALDVDVVGIRRGNFDTLGDEVKNADWLICVLPSDTGTDNVVDAKLLRKMKRSAVVINIGRGNAIDELALKRALESGHIGGALLDVYKREPLDKSSPLFGTVKNLVKMPHASAFYPEYLIDCFKELKEAGLLK